jgi:hypothetical protein
VLAGKLLAGAVLFGGVSLLALSAGIALYDFGLDKLVPAVLWSALTGVLLLSLMTLLQLLVAHRDNLQWMQTISRFLPTGATMDALHRLVNFGLPASSAAFHVVGLLLGTLVVGWLAVRAFRFQ